MKPLGYSGDVPGTGLLSHGDGKYRNHHFFLGQANHRSKWAMQFMAVLNCRSSSDRFWMFFLVPRTTLEVKVRCAFLGSDLARLFKGSSASSVYTCDSTMGQVLPSSNLMENPP